ncbi:ATP-dependent zinc protease [Marinobacter segnicrescens]|uniref:ATP-dependent zinc protease family protein n=1 Tax=Marinobacter segnicrescens TaxID=430453 RepID=UPI003A92C9F5
MYNPRDLDSQRDPMLSTSKLLAATLLALTTLLSGCAADSVLVDRYDMRGLQQSVADQNADLAYLKTAGDRHHQELSELQRESTRQILDTINEKVKPPECPPVPKAPVCTVDPSTDTGTSDRVKGKLVVGEVEKALLVGPNFVYDARIDSGAETSSMDARNVRRFERDGQEWVRFDIPVPGKDDAFETLERKVVRNVRIIQANEEDYERRAVVELQFRLGDHEQKAEFTLSDRAHLTYALLIGRNILRDVMLIDVGKEYSTELPRSIRTNAIRNN